MPDTDTDTEDPDVARDLYAVVVYLHADCNRDLFNQIAASELSFSQLQLLERLRGHRRQPTIRQAAAMMNVSQPAASRIIDALAHRGLVERLPDEGDYRAKRVAITPQGEQVITTLHQARHDRIQAFADQLDPDEHDALERALARLLRREPIAMCRPAA